MSVVSGKVIFCEGQAGSLDYRLLQLIVDSLSDPPTIVPCGGKFGFSTFASGYFSGNADVPWIAFRDRDFDVEPMDAVSLIQIGRGKTFLSHRATVENYLLDAELIHRYWDEKHQESLSVQGSRWAWGASPGMEALAGEIERAARSIFEYQAVRWALGYLTNVGGARKQLKTTWTRGSGFLPDSLELTYCRQEALEMIRDFRNSLETVTAAEFETQVNIYLTRFQEESFWSERRYLIWFQGKDILKAVSRANNRFPRWDSFFDWVLTPSEKRIDVLEHADLKELGRKIQELQ